MDSLQRKQDSNHRSRVIRPIFQCPPRATPDVGRATRRGAKDRLSAECRARIVRPPTEEVLAEMRAADPPVHYLVGTPKGRLTHRLAN